MCSNEAQRLSGSELNTQPSLWAESEYMSSVAGRLQRVVLLMSGRCLAFFLLKQRSPVEVRLGNPA